jgi:hypothetical protein
MLGIFKFDCETPDLSAIPHVVTIVFRDMVWKLTKRQSSFNELGFYVEPYLTSCTSFVLAWIVLVLTWICPPLAAFPIFKLDASPSVIYNLSEE